MIRHRRGDEFLLIAQHDHALLSGRFAERVGNDRFAVPSPFQETVDGVALHDCGWPLHDEQPTLKDGGLPLHVLESPMAVAVRVWSESARLASEKDAYSGLLVSLHVLALSAIAQTHDDTPHERYRDARDLFELNKFQHRQAELQEGLRSELRMRTDLPLHLGLAKPGTDPAEDLLLFNYNLLKLCDRLSLDLCCSENLFDEVEEVYPRPGAAPLTVTLGHRGEGVMAVDPWPFGAGAMEFEVPGRRVPARRYESEAEFQDVFDGTAAGSLRIRVEPVVNYGDVPPGDAWRYHRGMSLKRMAVSVVAAVLLAGCAETRSYQVAIRNETPQPITVGFAKEGGGPFEPQWASPEDIAIEHAGDPQQRGWDSVVVPPGKTGVAGPLKGKFDSSAKAFLRVYAGSAEMNDLLAIGRESSRRVDVPLVPGRNALIAHDQGGKLTVEHVQLPPEPQPK